MLEQNLKGAWQPLGLFSKKLSITQRKYSTYDRELLAIYEAIKAFRYMLEARVFVVRTDHKPLIYAFQRSSHKASPRQLRKLDLIGQFTTSIEHISGQDNDIADSLSRINEIYASTIVEAEELARQQDCDHELTELLTSETTRLKLQQLTPNNSDTPI